VPRPEAIRDRKAIHAYITAEAHDTLYSFAEENATSVSALVESWLMDLREEIAADGMEIRQDWVKRARKVDSRRRRRT
jgi:hypothetical protein